MITNHSVAIGDPWSQERIDQVNVVQVRLRQAERAPSKSLTVRLRLDPPSTEDNGGFVF